MLFDLDPSPEARFSDVVQASGLLRDALAVLGLDSCPLTTGGDGMHVRVPIARRFTHEHAREAPYSVRSGPRARVATPLDWDEVDEQLDPDRFTLSEVVERVERSGDLAARLLHGTQRLDAALARL